MRRIRRQQFLIAILAAALAFPAGAETDPNLATGFQADKAFAAGNVDSVNGFNGNLVITLPLASYPVGADLSYALTLIYNANGMEYFDLCPTPDNCTTTVAPRRANAGLGWNLGLGHIDLSEDGRWLYTASDGSEHAFFETLHDSETPVANVFYTRDSSYLRLQILGSEKKLEMPNGQVHLFRADGELTRIEDPFDNHIDIVRSGTDELVWQLQDSQGRIQTINFEVDSDADLALRKRISSVVLTGPNGRPVTYQFDYTPATIGAPCGLGGNILISLLNAVSAKNDQGVVLHTYSMPEYYQNETAKSCRVVGAIRSLVLPVGGKIEWTYQDYLFPRQTKRPSLEKSLGVATRTLRDRDGSQLGQWVYTTALNPPSADQAQELFNTVKTPLGHKTEQYFSVSLASPPSGSWTVFEYGLPLTHNAADATGTRFLSSREYDATGRLLRSTYVRYERDANSDSAVYKEVGRASKLNQRRVSTRVIYEAASGDPGRFIDTDFSEFDGLGHYRVALTSDNFEAPTQTTLRRRETTGWNQKADGTTLPRPAPPERWLLGTLGFQEQEEGRGHTRQEFDFETGTGFLRCQRLLRLWPNRDPFDVVTTFQRCGLGGVPCDANHPPGEIVTESWYGGDEQKLATGPDCAGMPGTPAYLYTHEYHAGVRSKTIAGGVNVLDLDIDPGTGLVTAERDASGHPTTFEYNDLWRLIRSIRQGDAATNIGYHMQVVPPTIESSVTTTTGQTLERETWTLDGFGRPVRHQMDLPADRWSTSITKYNAMGWQSFLSESSLYPQDPTRPGPNSDCKLGNGTSYCGYDAFGRPGKIVLADGKSNELTYVGARIVKRRSWVWTKVKDEQGKEKETEVQATTQEEYDGLGRLRKVTEPNGTVTRYSYDVGGRLVSVVIKGADGVQQRWFAYDGRGFLISEVHPEVGKPGAKPKDRATRYRYDARGNLTFKMTPTGSLFYHHDAAERLIRVGTGPAQQTDLLHWVYTNGTLSQASAYNDRMVGGVCYRFDVLQDFLYAPGSGRLQTLETTLRQKSANTNQFVDLEQWSHSYQYNGAGRIKQISYPKCLLNCSAGDRTVTTVYDKGRPVSIEGFASSPAAITYNDNGTVHTIDHGNGVLFTQTPDPTGMGRTLSLEAAHGTDLLWPKETYAYDGAGNIKQIGAKSFTYDVLSRLTSATFTGQGYRGYQYDTFGNLTRVYTAADHSQSIDYSTTTATNRLLYGSYDDSGNLEAFQNRCYTWDSIQRLAKVVTKTAPGASCASVAEEWVHTYDATGERVWSFRTLPTPRKDTFALRGPDSQILTEFTKQGAAYTWEDYIYREEQLLGARLNGQETWHFDVDHLGSVRLETDSAGNPQTKRYHDFWPYGEEATALLGTEQMRFTGHERDYADNNNPGDDLDNMHARQYNIVTGRFLSVDPSNLSSELGLPQSWNRYSYTIGNPIKLVDRNGAFWDYVADVVGLGWDIYQFAKEPSWGNAGFIGLDVVLGAIPFIPNTGAAKLGAKGVNALSDGLSLIAHNAEAGKAFEELVVAALQATKNKGEAVVVEGLGKSIPDILAKGGITEIKLVTSGRKVSYTRQLKIQIAAAQKAGVKFTLILSPGAKVTGPLEKAILEAGGTIVHFDPRTGMLLPYANVCG